jgi:hypothetical protein
MSYPVDANNPPPSEGACYFDGTNYHALNHPSEAPTQYWDGYVLHDPNFWATPPTEAAQSPAPEFDKNCIAHFEAQGFSPEIARTLCQKNSEEPELSPTVGVVSQQTLNTLGIEWRPGEMAPEDPLIVNESGETFASFQDYLLSEFPQYSQFFNLPAEQGDNAATPISFIPNFMPPEWVEGLDWRKLKNRDDNLGPLPGLFGGLPGLSFLVEGVVYPQAQGDEGKDFTGLNPYTIWDTDEYLNGGKPVANPGFPGVWYQTVITTPALPPGSPSDEELENLKKLSEHPVVEFVARSLFDSLDILMSVLEFLKKPGRDTAVNLGLALLPGALEVIGDFARGITNFPEKLRIASQLTDKLLPESSLFSKLSSDEMRELLKLNLEDLHDLERAANNAEMAEIIHNAISANPGWESLKLTVAVGSITRSETGEIVNLVSFSGVRSSKAILGNTDIYRYLETIRPELESQFGQFQIVKTGDVVGGALDSSERWHLGATFGMEGMRGPGLGHAETTIEMEFAKNYKLQGDELNAIGISNPAGPCADCASYYGFVRGGGNARELAFYRNGQLRLFHPNLMRASEYISYFERRGIR